MLLVFFARRREVGGTFEVRGESCGASMYSSAEATTAINTAV